MDKINNLPTTKEIMKFKAYTLIERAVEEGITFGLSRSYKHTITPDESLIQETILNEVMLALTEILDFETLVDNTF